MKQIFVVLAVLGAFAGLAQADEKVKVLSTQELIKECSLPANSESRSFCIGYTTAIYDTYLATRHEKRAKPFICVKQPAVVRDEIIADVVKFSQEHPKTADKPAAGVFLGYMAARFPCGKK